MERKEGKKEETREKRKEVHAFKPVFLSAICVIMRSGPSSKRETKEKWKDEI